MIVKRFGGPLHFGQKHELSSISHWIGLFIHHKTIWTDIANYLNYLLIGNIIKVKLNMPTTHFEPTHPCITGPIVKDKHCNFECGRIEKSIVVYQQWQATWVWQLGWTITKDDSGLYFQSYLPFIQSKPTGKCVHTGLKGSKSNSAIQE
jgi:hypothetical protein